MANQRSLVMVDGRFRGLPDTDSLITKAILIPLTNKSGGALVEGDVVVIGAANSNTVTTTTTSADSKLAGVVVIGGADNDTVYIAVAGLVAKVTVNAFNLNISPGDLLITDTTAKRAKAAIGSPSNGALLGKALESATTDGAQIAALITLA